MAVIFSNFNCISSIQKDHLILNMNHLLFKAAHPIYEDIYSQVNKSGKNNKMVMAEPNNCDTDSAALERLSQLLTTTTDGASEVSADLIALHVTNSLDDFTNFTNLFH